MRRTLAASLLLAVALTGCELQPTAPVEAPEASLARGKKNSTSRVAHTVLFQGDVLSAPMPDVMLYPDAPLSNLVIPTASLTLPVTPDLIGCGPVGGNWAPFEGNWTGYLVLTSDKSKATMNFVTSNAEGTTVWMSVEGAATTRTVGATTTLTFTDVTAVIKKDEYPLVIIFPCASFSIAATRQ